MKVAINSHAVGAGNASFPGIVSVLLNIPENAEGEVPHENARHFQEFWKPIQNSLWVSITCGREPHITKTVKKRTDVSEQSERDAGNRYFQAATPIGFFG